jgi:2-amino-4-hydroxy-6-hydroxymethyldihydropteridine diphosphokinase
MSRHTAYIGIGSNVGDRFANLQHAVDMLDLVQDTAVTAVSKVYLTEPVGNTEQECFFNGVAVIDTALSPEALRMECKNIEHTLGRPERYPQWSPRIIDLDILLYNGLCIKTDQLVIPHPELQHRKFVLIPLLDVGNPVHPVFRQRISDLVETSGDLSVPARLREQLVCKKRRIAENSNPSSFRSCS